MDKLINMIAVLGEKLSALNAKFYWYIDIETSIPWAIILIMYGLYKILNKYFLDKVLDGKELLKLIGIYLVVLAIIVGSYTDFREMAKGQDAAFSFMVLTLSALGLIILIFWLGSETDPGRRKRLILYCLYIPILSLIITNGGILEKNISILEAFMPRSDSEFGNRLNLRGEIEDVVIGGKVRPDLVEAVQNIINRHSYVAKSGVIGYKDIRDDLIKPYAFVELKDHVRERVDKITDPAKRKQEMAKIESEIRAHTTKGIITSGLSPYLKPQWYDFNIKGIPTTADGKVEHYKLQKLRKNWSKLFQVPEK